LILNGKINTAVVEKDVILRLKKHDDVLPLAKQSYLPRLEGKSAQNHDGPWLFIGGEAVLPVERWYDRGTFTIANEQYGSSKDMI